MGNIGGFNWLEYFDESIEKIHKEAKKYLASATKNEI